MGLLYFIQGMVYGSFTLIVGLIDTVCIYGEIACDNEQFLGEDDHELIAEEFENRIGCE